MDIEAPIIGAPMGPEITSLELAAAVSNAGGLGIISFGGYPPQSLRERIRNLRALTSRPFGINILLEGPHLPIPEAAFVDACIEERVPVLSFFWGDPTPYVEKAHKAGIKVCDQVGSVVAAKRAQRAGVDFVIAQGVEAGGHIAGTVSTMVLVPRVVDTVTPVPVVAAGGTPAQDASGDVESMNFLAGQSVGLVHEIKPAAEIVREVVEQAARVFEEQMGTVRAEHPSE